MERRKGKGLGKLLLFSVFAVCISRCVKVVSDFGEKENIFGNEKALGVRDSAPGVLCASCLATFEVLNCFCLKTGGKKFVCTWASCSLSALLPPLFSHQGEFAG